MVEVVSLLDIEEELGPDRTVEAVVDAVCWQADAVVGELVELQQSARCPSIDVPGTNFTLIHHGAALDADDQPIPGTHSRAVRHHEPYSTLGSGLITVALWQPRGSSDAFRGRAETYRPRGWLPEFGLHRDHDGSRIALIDYARKRGKPVTRPEPPADVDKHPPGTVVRELRQVEHRRLTHVASRIVAASDVANRIAHGESLSLLNEHGFARAA